jgi:hypothetical protein
MGCSTRVDSVFKVFWSSGCGSTCPTGSVAGSQAIKNAVLANSKKWILIAYLLIKTRFFLRF